MLILQTVFGLTCVSSGEIKLTVACLTYKYAEWPCEVSSLTPRNVNWAPEPNCSSEFPQHNETRWAFSLWCVTFTIYSLIFLIAQLFDLTKSHLLNCNGFFQFPPSDWITSTIDFFFFLQLLITCKKILFLFWCLKYPGPSFRVGCFVVIWLTHVQTGVASFYWILKKERERNNFIKSFSHQITAIPAGVFSCCYTRNANYIK